MKLFAVSCVLVSNLFAPNAFADTKEIGWDNIPQHLQKRILTEAILSHQTVDLETAAKVQDVNKDWKTMAVTILIEHKQQLLEKIQEEIQKAEEDRRLYQQSLIANGETRQTRVMNEGHRGKYQCRE